MNILKRLLTALILLTTAHVAANSVETYEQTPLFQNVREKCLTHFGYELEVQSHWKTIQHFNGSESVEVSFPKTPSKYDDGEFLVYNSLVSKKASYTLFTNKYALQGLDYNYTVSLLTSVITDEGAVISKINHHTNTNIPYADIEGSDFIDGKKYSFKCRVYVSQNGFYFLGTEYTKSKHVDFNKFVGSFKIK